MNINFVVAEMMISAVICAVSQPTDTIQISCNRPLSISNIYANRSQVALYEKFEITFDLEGHWDNPFDPDQVKVDAEFACPDGSMMIVPGFFYQQYTRILKDGEDLYKPVGEPAWKVRFAPAKTGEYTYKIKVANKGQEITSQEDKFICTADTANHGFIRVSDSNPLYFEYDDGTPFFAVANCKWWDNICDIETFYTEFARAGGNMTRNFLMRIGELVDPPVPRPDRGFGKIDLDRSWRHDQMMELCEKLGICQQLSIANGTYFLKWDKNRWRMCVYNKLQGGFIGSQQELVKEYFANKLARQNFKGTLRYFVARWGYSTAVFSWNLWNEIDLIPEYGKIRHEAQEWHREMAQYLEQIDWADHVIHTNFKTINGDSHLDALPEMDIVSVNTYTMMDFAPVAELWIKRHLSAYQKPVMFSEFGIGHSYGKEGYAPHDPERIMAHNGMWSALMSGSAATGMAFGWNWLANEKYYTYVEALAKYVEDIPFCKRDWQPVAVEFLRFKDANQGFYYADKFIEGWHMNYNFPKGWKQYEEFQINPDGSVSNHDSMSGFLSPPLGKNKISLKMNYPEAGEFVIFVPEIFLRDDSPGFPKLKASLDDKAMIEQELIAEANNTRNLYQHYSFPVAKGSHTITLENTGGGFFPVGYELRNFMLREGPNLEIRGQQANDIIMLWIKNPKLTWLYSRMGFKPQEQPAGILALNNVPDGIWIAEWVDTMENRWIKHSVEESRAGKLHLDVPPVCRSIAVKLFKMEN